MCISVLSNATLCYSNKPVPNIDVSTNCPVSSIQCGQQLPVASSVSPVQVTTRASHAIPLCAAWNHCPQSDEVMLMDACQDNLANHQEKKIKVWNRLQRFANIAPCEERMSQLWKAATHMEYSHTEVPACNKRNIIFIQSRLR